MILAKKQLKMIQLFKDCIRRVRRKSMFLRVWPPICGVDFGDLRRTQPIDNLMSYGRGEQSIPRYYIESFVSSHANCIHGNVLEIGDNKLTTKYGGLKVIKSDVLHAIEGNNAATIVADLTKKTSVPDNYFDCIILTHTLQFINDYQNALKEIYRILKHGGIVISTHSGISQISRYDMQRWGEYWRFTSFSIKKVFSEVFRYENVEVIAFGNVLAAISTLHGLTSKELNKNELDYSDKDYEVVLGVTAIK